MGHYASTGAASCIMCPRGRFAERKGSESCSGCPIGRFGFLGQNWSLGLGKTYFQIRPFEESSLTQRKCFAVWSGFEEFFKERTPSSS